MATVTTNSRFYKAIAAAIRGKNGKDETYTPQEMPAAIAAIPYESYTFTATSGQNKVNIPIDDTVSMVAVAVEAPKPNGQEGTGMVSAFWVRDTNIAIFLHSIEGIANFTAAGRSLKVYSTYVTLESTYPMLEGKTYTVVIIRGYVPEETL